MKKPVTSISASTFIKNNQSSGTKLRVIDVRTPAEVNAESLDGSARFPLQDLHWHALQQHLNEHNHDSSQPVYILCGSGQRATRAAEQLQGDIDNQLVIIEGGINALKQLGVNVTKGSSNVISLERQVRITAGSLVVLGVALGFFVAPGFYGLSAFVGAGLVFAGVTDSCGMGMALARMPWNK